MQLNLTKNDRKVTIDYTAETEFSLLCIIADNLINEGIYEDDGSCKLAPAMIDGIQCITFTEPGTCRKCLRPKT